MARRAATTAPMPKAASVLVMMSLVQWPREPTKGPTLCHVTPPS